MATPAWNLVTPPSRIGTSDHLHRVLLTPGEWPEAPHLRQSPRGAKRLKADVFVRCAEPIAVTRYVPAGWRQDLPSVVTTASGVNTSWRSSICGAGFHNRGPITNRLHFPRYDRESSSQQRNGKRLSRRSWRRSAVNCRLRHGRTAASRKSRPALARVWRSAK